MFSIRTSLPTSSAFFAACLVLSSGVRAQQAFDVPLRISMAGVETVDSLGRTWLGDAGGDPLGIRPDDAGGANEAPGWSLPAFQPDSLDALGYDSTNAGDVAIFNNIRWDDAATPPDFRMEIPIANGSYTVNMYFNELCCPNRHFQIEIQGEIVDDDVSYLDYDPANPTLGRVGKLSFDGIQVQDGLLKIGLLPCLQCPGATDGNAIIDALEVVSGPGCDNLGLDFNCAWDSGTGAVHGTWKAQASADHYHVIKNGQPFGADLPAGATGFDDADPASGGPFPTYVVQALDGNTVIEECRCSLKTFTTPRDLVCDLPAGSTDVALSWTPGENLPLTGYEVRRNGEVIANLTPADSSYEDTPKDRFLSYTVTPVTDPPGLAAPLTCQVVAESVPFKIPLRINMGGRETVDSKGNVWLGDGPGPGDPLGIRVDDLSGTNWIENWTTGILQPDSLAALGFDPSNPGDLYIFDTIRWDVGNDGIDFNMELAVPNGDYLVNLFFNEQCCPGRHFKVQLQGDIADDDVSYLDYDPVTPALGRAGRLSFNDISVTDGILRLSLLPCPDCPGAVDTNAIIDAIEVVPAGCADPTFRQCPRNFTCTTDTTGAVALSWEGPLCVDIQGYELRKNGTLIGTFPADKTSFTDNITTRTALYQLTILTGPGVDPCPAQNCTAVATDLAFEVPLRLKMGGVTTVDSRGRTWWGDGGGAGDILSIRPDDLSATNTIQNWCTVNSLANADSIRSFGLDPFDPRDQYILNGIRWDLGADGIDYRLELPVANGVYQVSLYFTECCCTQRHFQIEIQGNLLDDDVSYLKYDQNRPDLGRTGRLVFDDIEVSDGILRIGLLPCPTCPDPLPVDTNAILDALEVLPGAPTVLTCPRSLVTSLGADGKVTGVWTGPENVTVKGYDLFRDGEKVTTLDAGATTFTDQPTGCKRITVYELDPLSDDPSFLCPGLKMQSILTNPDCPFQAPLRINMGAVGVVDSHGDLWLGDGPGPGDPLEIRPDDAGGINTVENWSTPVFQADSLTALGFDPKNIFDAYIFNSIRWDPGVDGIDWRMEIPIEDGEYTVNMYFNEGCCLNRHFMIELQGEIVDDDVSYLDYVPAAPAMGKVGKLTFDAVVTDGILKIALLPCPGCPGGGNTDSILDALEVLGGGAPPAPKFRRGDADASGKVDLTDAIVILSFLFQGGASPTCLDAADSDDSGKIDLTDGIFVLSWLFQGGTEPPAPGPQTCGPDTTPSASITAPCVYNTCQ